MHGVGKSKRGSAAKARILYEATTVTLPLRLERIRIVLSHPSHPGNIGAAARAMKTMGLSQLVLVNPRAFPDPQADAMAAAALDVLANARVVATLSEALTGTLFATALTARRRELAVEPLWAREAAAELVSAAGEGDVAVVFGNETSGLSNDEVALCRRWASIPTQAGPQSGGSSLNLAQAVQVMCYEMRMAARDPGSLPPVSGAGQPASHDDVEGLLGHLERAAFVSGYLDPDQPKRFMPRMRRLLARANIEQEEIGILRGLLTAFEKCAKKID
jgi:tRNA/rRNA methyltransferase